MGGTRDDSRCSKERCSAIIRLVGLMSSRGVKGPHGPTSTLTFSEPNQKILQQDADKGHRQGAYSDRPHTQSLHLCAHTLESTAVDTMYTDVSIETRKPQPSWVAQLPHRRAKYFNRWRLRRVDHKHGNGESAPVGWRTLEKKLHSSSSNSLHGRTKLIPYRDNPLTSRSGRRNKHTTAARLFGISGLAEAVHMYHGWGFEAVGPPVYPPKRVQELERGIGEVQDGVMKHLGRQKHRQTTGREVMKQKKKRRVNSNCT